MSVIKNNKTYGIRVKLLQPEPMPEPIHAETYFYVEDIIGDGMTCSVSAYSTLQYSTDGTNWQTIQISDTTEQLSVPAKGRLYMYGSGENYRIKCNAPFNTGGNIMSLFYGNDFQGHTESVNLNYLFENSLIYKCKTVFPSTTVGGGYYQYMFYECRTLIQAPELPATTVYEYAYTHMFENCTSLTTAPVLPATTLADWCYSSMFQDCVNLTTAPVLPVTTLAAGCYSFMFSGCTALTTAPALPATTADYSCYSFMFSGCTALTTAPALPATTLDDSCYFGMFAGCTSLTTAPVLPATTLARNCYYEMFSRCTNLNSVTSYATDGTTDYLTDWLLNVSATGDFYNLGGASYSSGASGIPEGWTEHTSL